MKRLAILAASLAVAALALAGCGDCRRTVHLELDFDAPSSAANRLIVTFPLGSVHTLNKAAGSARETLDIKVSSVFVGQPLAVTVQAYVNQALVATSSSTLDTADSSCPLHYVAIGNAIVPGSDDMSRPGGGGMCAGGCGSGPCAGSCAGGVCSYPTSSCGACVHGVARGGGSCGGGSCSNTSGAPTQCLDGICAQEYCAGIEFGARTVAAGNGFTCAVLDANFGTELGVRCWGKNVGGVLGVDPNVLAQAYVPTWVAGSEGLTTLVAGDDFVCGRDSNSVRCWGSNQLGQLGLGKSDNLAHPVPTAVVGLPSGTPIVGAGGQHACAAIASGIYCWGKNGNGELGTLPAVAATPAQVTLAGLSVHSVVLGTRHMCFSEQTASGGYDVRCLGNSDVGQVGMSGGNFTTPVPISGFTTDVALSAGGDTTCAGATLSQSDLKCWGSNSHGQLGGGGAVGAFSTTAVSVCGGMCNSLSDFAVGYDHVCAGFSDGVKCWGNGATWMLGVNMSGDQSAPNLAAIASSSANVAAGRDQSCATISASSITLRCWGNNADLQLGLPASTASSSPGAPHWSD